MAFGGGNQDIEIRVKVDAEGAINVLDGLGNEIGKVDTSSKNAEGGISKFQANILTVDSAARLATIGVNLLSGAFDTVLAGIRRGSEVDDISSSFQNLADQAGIAGDTLLNSLNAALDNTIPNIEVMQQANELLIGGLKPEQIELVASAARSLGEATGVSAKEGMNQMADSLLRGNDRALKTLGIIIDTEKAFDDFAKTIGTTSEALNEQGRATAIREASLKALAEAQGRLGEVTTDAGDRLDQFNTVLSNAADQFFQTLSQNEAFNSAMDTLIGVISNIDFTPIVNGLSSIVSFAASATEQILKFTSAISAFTSKSTSFDKAIAKNVAGLEYWDASFDNIIDNLSKGTKEGTAKATAEFNKLGKIFETMVNNGDLLDSQINVLNEDFAKIREQIIGATSTTEDLDNVTKELTTTTEKLARGGYVSLKKEAEAAERAQRKLAQEGLKKVEEEARELDKALDDLATNDWAEKLAGDLEDAQQGGGIFGGIFDNLFGEGIEDIKGGRQFGENLTNFVGDAFSEGIGLAFSGGKSEDYAQAFGSLLTDFGAQFADSILPGSGQFVAALEPLVNDLLEGLFGGDDAGTEARKAADKFFADAFEANRLSVIVNGQLKQIEDLVFKGDTLFGGNSQFEDGSFANFFETLPGIAQQSFIGVGTAFEELLGIGEDVGGQLAAVFANNVGGSLNNLQLLVEASGKSFEELRGAVVEAFLDGKLSAQQAQVALQGIAQVAQKGIPDAVGATVQAFYNLKDAGVSGGRASIDALKDLGYEAKELGINTLPGLMAQLQATGQFTAQEIQQLFDTLSKHGITSIDQLVNATNEQLIGVLAQLQNQSFPFAAAIDDASSLVETIDKLPGEKTLTFNIRTNFDSNTQKAQDLGYVPKLSTSSTAGSGVSV